MNKNTSTVIIGLCGRSGSGKGYLSELFREIGVQSIDTDAVYREITCVSPDGKLTPCMSELISEFGTEILNSDRSLNRHALADVVFAAGSKEKLDELNRITHKYILEETAKRIALAESSGETAVIIDAPLMFESGCDKMCDVIIAADAPEDVLMQRITKRDRIDTNAARRRLASQISSEELAKRANFVINTDRPRDELKAEVSKLLLHITDKNYDTKGKNEV